MRVVYLINALGEGGTERSLADLLPELRDRGLEISIITLRSHGDEGVEPLLRAQGFDIATLGGGGTLGAVRAVRAHLRALDPDVVHTMLFEANLVGRLATVGLRARVVTSLVNTTYSAERLDDPRLNRFKIRAVQAADTVLGRLRTHHFHAVSHAVADDAERALRIPARRMTVIERGRRTETLPAPTPQRRQRARRELGLADTATVLVTVGRQEYQKGLRYLLEAMHELGPQRDVVLLAAGREGNESATLQAQLAEMPDVAARTRLLGHRSDVADLLAAADIFVFPSLFEGMPGAVIEAMASGLPIVASDIAPVREIVEPGANATLAPLRDPTRLAAAIADLLDDEQRRERWGARSREIFEDRFTMERSVAGFVEMYARLCT